MAAVDLPADQARQRMIDATWPGGHEPDRRRRRRPPPPATRRKLKRAGNRPARAPRSSIDEQPDLDRLAWTR